MKKLLLVVLLCLVPSNGFAMCGPVSFSAYTSAPSNSDGKNWISIEYKTYFSYSWSFPFVVPKDHAYYLTDILFQAKNIPGQRPSYLVLSGLYTVTSDIGQVHFKTPLILPEEFTLTGAFDNNTSDSSMNMIAMVSGVVVDSMECWQTWK